MGTVSRAYAEAERRGLVSGEVGRGTFVRGPQAPESYFVHDERAPGTIDLGLALPPPGSCDRYFGPALKALAEDPRAAALLTYQPGAGRAEHRAAGAEWLARRGFQVPPERIIVTNGGNHGIAVALAATTRPGDRLLIERLSYAVIQPIARMLGLRLEGLAADEKGILPEAVEAACRAGDARALYCIPTLQNPTTSIMPEERRRAIAEAADRHDLAVLEDDTFAHLVDQIPPALTSFLPERGYYITSLSKTLAPGLRVGYVAGPARAIENLTGAVRATSAVTWGALAIGTTLGAELTGVPAQRPGVLAAPLSLPLILLCGGAALWLTGGAAALRRAWAEMVFYAVGGAHPRRQPARAIRAAQVRPGYPGRLGHGLSTRQPIRLAAASGAMARGGFRGRGRTRGRPRGAGRALRPGPPGGRAWRPDRPRPAETPRGP